MNTDEPTARSRSRASTTELRSTLSTTPRSSRSTERSPGLPPARRTRATTRSKSKNNGGIHLEFTGAEGRSMIVELLFDGYETRRAQAAGRMSRPRSASSSTLASVWKPGSTKEDERRPHRCVVTWGELAPCVPLRDRVAVDEVHDVLLRGRAAARDLHGEAQGSRRRSTLARRAAEVQPGGGPAAE